MKNFEDLKLWQRSMDLVKEIYKVSSLFPKEEMYSLTSQMRRAAVSVPSNIAEGNTGRSIKEYSHFLTITYGSLAELKTQILIAQRLCYIADQECKNVLQLINEVTKILHGVRRFLNTKKLIPNI